MEKFLFSWVGAHDLAAADDPDPEEYGAVARSMRDGGYTQAVLLISYPKARVKPYLAWLKKQTSANLHPTYCTLADPTDHGAIYEVAGRTLQTWQHGRTHQHWSFNLTSGTPAMCVVWVLLANSRFPARLVDAQRIGGLREVVLPFSITAAFLPTLLARPDRELNRLAEGKPPEDPAFRKIIHGSTIMRRLVARAEKVAARSIPVLLQGPSGTGKELFARTIHDTGPRRHQPFVPLNCGAIPPDLVESTLFGHVKGAFTGAEKKRDGYFQAAHGGTLFLDEVGELPLAVQVRLLRVLQEGRFQQVGATEETSVDVRIIAATNRNLAEEVAEGRFREDLYYRLAVAVLNLPSLAQRREDLPLLVDTLLTRVNHELNQEPGFQPVSLTTEARELLLSRPWPGNVRELLNTLRGAAVWASDDTITVADVSDALFPSAERDDSTILDRDLSQEFHLDGVLDEVRRHYLTRAMQQEEGYVTRAARLLGYHNYQTFKNHLKDLGLQHLIRGRVTST